MHSTARRLIYVNVKNFARQTSITHNSVLRDILQEINNKADRCGKPVTFQTVSSVPCQNIELGKNGRKERRNENE